MQKESRRRFFADDLRVMRLGHAGRVPLVRHKPRLGHTQLCLSKLQAEVAIEEISPCRVVLVGDSALMGALERVVLLDQPRVGGDGPPSLAKM
jgi:hypothetical protein